MIKKFKLKKIAFLKAIFFLYLVNYPVFASEDKITQFIHASDQSPSYKKCEKIEEKFSPLFILNFPKNITLSHFEEKSNNHDENSKKNEIYNIVRVPESGPEWWSIGLSFIAILISVSLPSYQFRKQRNSSVNEGFWLREVIFPKLNETAFETVKKLKTGLKLPESDFLVLYQTVIIPLLNELKDTSDLLNAFTVDDKMVTDIENLCDELEDDVSNSVLKSYDIRLATISTFHNDLTTLLIKFHLKNA